MPTGRRQGGWDLKNSKRKINWKNRLDKIFAERIKARDKYCVRCLAGRGQAQMQCAHVRSRRFLGTRWLTENGLCLCAGCHFWAHQNPVEFGVWFVGKYPERWSIIRLESNKIKKYIASDYETIYNTLKGECDAGH